jgi:hypothetical protein
MLLDDSVRAHDRALQAGTKSHIDVWWQLPHVFPVMRMLPEARAALRSIAAFIAQHRTLPRAVSAPATDPFGATIAHAAATVAVEPADRPSP